MKSTLPAWWLTIAGCLAIAMASPLAAQEIPRSLTLSSSNSPEVPAATEVLRKAYGRIGISIDVSHTSGAEEALRLSSTGQLDGEINRIDGITEQFPTLVQVAIPINFVEIAVWSTDSTFVPRGWFDLAGRDVTIVRGIVAAERGTSSISVQAVDSYETLVSLFNQGEIEVMVAPVLLIDQAQASGSIRDDVVLNAVLDTHLLYHYVHESHAAVVPLLEPILKEMLLDGTTGRIRDEVLARPRADAATGGR